MERNSEKVSDCLGCMPSAETKKELGGSVWEGNYWRVSHCNGPFGEGTMVVEPKRHVADIESLNGEEQAEMVPVFRDVSEAVKEVCGAERVYIEHWTHTAVAHAHWLFIPVTKELVHKFGDKKGPNLIAAMADANNPLDKEVCSGLSKKIGARISELVEGRKNREKEMWLAVAEKMKGGGNYGKS